MRFVTPDVERIQLTNGDWIEVKKELTVGEERRYRSAGMRNITPNDGGQSTIEIDWGMMAIARAMAYLVDWSDKRPIAKDADRRSAIESLAQEDFNEIDQAIETHIAKQVDAKNAKSGNEKQPPTLPS